jgi:lipopolysaccharide/colanic/teichoic acid biosynthesis glycosyltransferase
VLDVVGAAIGLVILSPVIACTAVAVAVSMGRPVLFRHARPGLRGELFTLYKFRTMRPAREGEVYFRTDKERLTSLGRILRRTSIDELPELWNVLRGEMSLIGPRPLLAEYLTRYTARHAKRHDVRPGITGWAQVNGRQTIPFSARLDLDVWYVENWSLWLDMKILVMTARDVFRRSGVIPGQDVDDVDDLGLTREDDGRDAHTR